MNELINYLIIYEIIMNYDSGFIIGIVRKFCENPNRTFTKSILKITLTVLIFDKKPLRVSFSIA